jgi:hypothetical protein
MTGNQPPVDGAGADGGTDAASTDAAAPAVPEAVAALRALAVAVERVLGVDLSGLGDQELVGWVADVERLRRRVETIDHVVVAEVDRRDLPGRWVITSTHRLLGPVWGVTAGVAKTRVTHARALSPRITLTGAVLAPVVPVLAQARCAGAVGGEHVRVILATLHALPAALPPEQVQAAERVLVDAARGLDPHALSSVGRRLRDTLDPDGTYRDEGDLQRRRTLTLHDLGDGMTRISGDLDPETGALARAVIGAWSAPQPRTPPPGAPPPGGEPGTPDTGTGSGSVRDLRSPGQRRHDAFRQLLTRALNGPGLPTSGGVPATVLITMTAEQFSTGTGLVTTSHGQHLTVPTALRIAGTARIAWVVHNSRGGILTYGTTRRVPSTAQTLALIARDQGCAFPSCDRPPEWTERHHITPWAQGGETNLNNLVLLCDHHHDHHTHRGWTITIHDGVPWFTPPPWHDPTQTPIRHPRHTQLQLT